MIAACVFALVIAVSRAFLDWRRAVARLRLEVQRGPSRVLEVK